MPLNEIHRQKAVMTDFAGYELPLYYTSIIEEHLAVRTHSGIFDVSHMGRILVEGEDSFNFLERILPVSVSSKKDMKAFYSFMLDERGTILDDLIVLRLSSAKYIVVVNAANREKDFAHINKYKNEYSVSIKDITSQTCMFAVQGPKSIEIMSSTFPEIPVPDTRYTVTTTQYEGKELIVSRTGYTGEDGLEIIAPCADSIQTAKFIWEQFSRNSKECGLGSRDTLRIEAGLPLYGNEIDEKTSPFELGLERLIAWDKEFIGKEAIAQKTKPERLISGLVLEKDIPRTGFEVKDEQGNSVGVVTSGTYSPILRKGIALAKISSSFVSQGKLLYVQVRGSNRASNVVKPPFYDTSKYGYKRVKQ